MSYKLRYTGPQIDDLLTKIDGISNTMQFKGVIATASGFPLTSVVDVGWIYMITSDVTDNDATKTNTGLSFQAGDEIIWDGTTWIEIGPYELFALAGNRITPVANRQIATQNGDKQYPSYSFTNFNTTGFFAGTDGTLHISLSDTDLIKFTTSGDIVPITATQDLGTAANPFRKLYTLEVVSTTGPITAEYGLVIGKSGGNSGAITFVASDNDQGTISINTSDALLFTGFTGGYTFDNTVTLPTPFTLGATSVTTTGTQLNYLNSATGTTGTTTTNLVFSTSPVLTTPTITTKLNPTTDDGAPLGDTTHNWSDLFLASGAVINYANSNVVLTHSSGILTLGTGSLKISAPTNASNAVLTTDATQTLTNKTLTSPYINEAVVLTTTATKLNYLTSATGTTGTASTNLVFSTSPTLVTPILGVATATSLALGGAIISTHALAVTGTINISSTSTFGGSVLLPNGTVSLPALSFSGDTNTGIYSVGADQLGIAVNGTNMVTVTTTGVGIGTTAPGYKLDVSQSTASTGLISAYFNNNDYTATNRNAIRVRQQTGVSTGYSAYLGLDATSHNLFLSNDSIAANHLVITTTGNVGIGTTSPQAKLHISNLTGNLQQILGTNTGNNVYLDFFEAGTSWGSLGTNGNRIEMDGVNNKFNIYGAVGSTIVTHLSMDRNTGNVGIGTTSPGAPLEVSTATTNIPQLILRSSNTAPGNLGIVLRADSGATASNRNYFIGANTIAYGDFNIQQSNALGGDPLTAGTSRLYIKNDGNVGINLTSPSLTCTLLSTGTFGWDNGSGTGDVILRREAANTLALRNSTSAQTFNLYNTYTDASNYERFITTWIGGNVYIGTSKAGTGIDRQIYFIIGGASKWNLATSGDFMPVVNNTVNLGASGTTVRTGYFGTSVQTASLNLTGIQEISASTYTVLSTDSVIRCNCSSNSITLTLPAVASNLGKLLVIKKTDSTTNQVIIDANSSELIDSDLTLTMYDTGDSFSLIATSSGWIII